jgi:hypothetical protein
MKSFHNTYRKKGEIVKQNENTKLVLLIEYVYYIAKSLDLS